MSTEAVLTWLGGGMAFLLALLLKHMFDCRKSSERLTRIEQHLKDKTGFMS